MAPGSWIWLAYFTNVCLGRLQCCKFSQKSDVASSVKWKNYALNNINKSLWFSGVGAGLSPWSHGFNPCCIHFFFCWIINPYSSFILLNHDTVYSMLLLAGIFPAKQTQQKLVECSEISSSVIRTHKTPLQTHNYFPDGFQQKKTISYGDVTLVKDSRDKIGLHLSLLAVWYTYLSSLSRCWGDN